MDNKIKYVDLNGLKVFAESLKQDLKNHVIELGLYQELLHRIENLELYKIVDSLPKIGDEDTIYLFKNPSGSGDKNVFIEYLYNNEHGWEEIGNFTPSFDLEDYLKIENASFEKGGSENSAVLKGGNNQVISEGGVALGSNNLVGLKGWYYGSINKISDTTIDVYISESQRRPTWGGTTKLSNINPYEVLGYGRFVSLVNDTKYDDKFRVVGGAPGHIRLQTLSGNLPFSSITTELFLDPEDYSIYCISKPDAGVADIGQDSVASGYNNKATNGKSTVFGFNNHAYGKFSFVEGRDNEAGYAAHAEGRGNVASGEQSHVEGKNNKALGNNSHVEGNSNIANDYSAHAEGYGSVVSSDINDHEPIINDNATNAAYSHAEGNGTVVRNHSAHAEGRGTIVLGNSAHAEGLRTQANANASHAEGNKTIANGSSSHTEGLQTITNNTAEHASGQYNKSTKSTDKAEATHFSIGIGTSDTKRKNAFEVKQNGDTYLCIGGKLYFVTPITDDELNELFND